VQVLALAGRVGAVWLLRRGPVAIEAVVADDRPLDERSGEILVAAGGQLPAQHARGDLAGARAHRGSGHAAVLGRELLPGAQADEQPALPLRVGDGERLERPARLARGEHLAELLRQALSELLVLEHPERDRVGIALQA